MNTTERRLLMILLLAALVTGTTMFVTGLRTIPPSTDESIIMLQAKHILNPPTEPDLRHSMHPKPLFFRFPLLFMAQPYLFPLEAYLAAVPSLFLPPGQASARAVAFALGLGTLFFSALVLRGLGGLRASWPGFLLLAFPSSYVLMMQFGYALPSYPSHLFLVILAVWLMQRYLAQPTLRAALLSGAVCAAALAGQLMAIGLPLLCGVLILWSAPTWRNKLAHTGGFVALTACGWFPYALAMKLYGGAYLAVSGSWPLRDAVKRLWTPALDHVLPVASGIKSSVFPDNTRYIEIFPTLTIVWPYVWIALVLAAGLLWLVRLPANRWQPADQRRGAFIIFTGLSIAAIALFIVSRRSHSHTFRYLLTAAWALPFLLAYVHATAPWRILRRAVAGIAVVLALVNALTMVGLWREWTTPGFGGEEASLYDARPALAYLKENNLRHVYASYHLAYRLTYLADETIIAAQYYNERFLGWPLPYKSYVDLAPRPAFVLAPRFAINATRFENDLQAMGLRYTRHQAGDLTVFHDFAWREPPGGDWLTLPGYRAETSANPSDAVALTDGDYAVRWRSRQEQSTSQWVTVSWKTPATIKHIYMYYNLYHHDRAEALDVDAWVDDAWVTVCAGVPRGMDEHEFENGRPVYGNQFQRIVIDPVTTTRLRIRNTGPVAGRDWTIGEIRLWGEPAP